MEDRLIPAFTQGFQPLQITLDERFLFDTGPGFELEFAAFCLPPGTKLFFVDKLNWKTSESIKSSPASDVCFQPGFQRVG